VQFLQATIDIHQGAAHPSGQKHEQLKQHDIIFYSLLMSVREPHLPF